LSFTLIKYYIAAGYVRLIFLFFFLGWLVGWCSATCFSLLHFFFPGGNENRPANKVHSHLKTFEMVGFLAAEVDVELVLYLAKFAIVLEKVILYPFLPAKERILKKKTLHLLGALEEKAKQLKNELPARVQLQLL